MRIKKSRENSNHKKSKKKKLQTMYDAVAIVQTLANEANVPSATSKVYKDQCMYTFDSPESPDGLYISLRSFHGYGKDILQNYQHKISREPPNRLYLNIRRKKIEIESEQGDGPEKKVTRLAIGVEGGFNPDQKKYESIDSYHLVVIPEFISIPLPNELPERVQKSIDGIIAAQSATKAIEIEALEGTWDGEFRAVSKHSDNLQQLNNGVKIPPSGWKCQYCDLTENLWLNLTDGAILCGRKFFDGSGGNNHAVEHYEKTKHPLAVKLGTVSNEGKADVYSYDEDDMVIDKHLNKHLAHFGINIHQMEKTDKSMAELELDLNQRAGEWSTLQENNSKLEPIYGPGFTGMINLGNSCYLNSVMQVLFTVPDFIRCFYDKFDEIVNRCDDPVNDFTMQMAKLAHGLLSGKYSQAPESPNDYKPNGIEPYSFKHVVGRGHAEFSTKNQQDAQEFFSHVLELVNRHCRNQDDNPSDAFKFKLEERYQCEASGGVKYIELNDSVLHVTIPLETATNKDDVTKYEQEKAACDARKEMFRGDVVRPRIQLYSCLDAFAQPEIVEQFYSSIAKTKTTARKTTRFATFPDHLMIHPKKFMLRDDWTPIKLDVALDVPDVLDITHLRARGQQPNETLLPSTDAAVEPAYDPSIMTELMTMGFPQDACKRALYFTRNSSLELATNWIMEHMTDADFAEPFVPPGVTAPTKAETFVADENGVAMIMSMGFNQAQAVRALKATQNNTERALDWILSHHEEMDAEEGVAPVAKAVIRDGDGRYRLLAIISHMGTSTQVGHYVCHIRKGDKWVIFNDDKVAVSENPPKELGYLYLFERITS